MGIKTKLLKRGARSVVTHVARSMRRYGNGLLCKDENNRDFFLKGEINFLEMREFAC